MDGKGANRVVTTGKANLVGRLSSNGAEFLDAHLPVYSETRRILVRPGGVPRLAAGAVFGASALLAAGAVLLAPQAWEAFQQARAAWMPVPPTEVATAAPALPEPERPAVAATPEVEPAGPASIAGAAAPAPEAAPEPPAALAESPVPPVAEAPHPETSDTAAAASIPEPKPAGVANLPFATPARPSPGLLLVARHGDTLRRLYKSVYSGVRPPPFREVQEANPTTIRPGAVLLFPTPPDGWRRP